MDKSAFKSIYDMKFMDVLKAFIKLEEVNKTNNIRERTRLLKKHPELFDKAIYQEVKKIYQMCQSLSDNDQHTGRLLPFPKNTHRQKTID